jgi:hypothetical protein
MSAFWPAGERARVYGFSMNIALASIITAPLSGWMLFFIETRT